MQAPAWCEHCGRPAAECDGGCRRPLDPPRFCPACGRPRRVQVTPTGYTTRCACEAAEQR
ncbi:MAG TPA: hypothetical protein VGM21_00995 [Actinomycetota bacterium]